MVDALVLFHRAWRHWFYRAILEFILRARMNARTP
jgi:hypothetical protein